MRFIDLQAQQGRIRSSIEDRIRTVLDHGQYIMGPEVLALEQRLAEYTGTLHALGCSSGTDALVLALMAYGVGPGDAVITTPFTFMATAEAISLTGATPLFVDIAMDTFNIDPGAIERVIEDFTSGKGKAGQTGLKMRGIIAVDLFGVVADYERINRIAEQHGIFVIQDAAQSFGAERAGMMAGSAAGIGCTSFFPAKPLGGYGDGGMCFTSDEDLFNTMVSLRVHGQGADKYENVRIGLNARLDTLQAAILLSKFELFPEELTLRQRVAEMYNNLLGHPGSPVAIPSIPQGCRSAWAQYTVMARDQRSRNAIIARLGEAGIPTAIYYPKPLHLQTAFSQLGYRAGDLPVSESTANRVFSLPMHPYLTEDEQERIASVILSD